MELALYKFAMRRIMPLFTILSIGSSVTLPGCGGSSTPSITPSPGATAEPGRGIAADVCNAQGSYAEQPGWTGGCGVPVQPKRKWTVLLYMNGANDLEEYGDLNLNQIERYGSDSNVTFVAQYKRYRATKNDYTGDGDWLGARRFVVRKDNTSNHVGSPIVSSRADIDMGNPQTLKEFVSWGVQTFPAERYAIVLWNHGAGWRSRKSAITRGFSLDDEKGTEIDTSELSGALDLGGGRKWDLVSWDSSLMQMVEVGYEIRNQTHWIVGSEESPPGPGLPYHLWANKLLANPNADGRFVGETICEAMQEGYANTPKITQSLVDPAKMDALARAVNDFGEALSSAKTKYGTQIADARRLSEYFKYEENKSLLDFVHLVKESVPDNNVQRTADAVESVAKSAIVKNYNDSYHPNAKGIAIYIPSPSIYRDDDITMANYGYERYINLRFSRAAPNWQSFLADGPR